MAAQNIYPMPAVYLYDQGQPDQDPRQPPQSFSRADIHRRMFPLALAQRAKIASEPTSDLMAFGMKPVEVAAADDRGPPLLTGSRDRVASIQPGQLADVVAARETPLADITELELNEIRHER
jgi:hypothetical protein